ncbi:MAG TPA: cytochrome P450, partial [Candidatus Saccharimonadales bacterium]|nr:cytochrome P450 [Candidatus Saccharimonadales bacterium]
ELPDPVLAIFYFPWAAGSTKADGSPGSHTVLRKILKASLTPVAVQRVLSAVELYARELLCDNVLQNLPSHETVGVIDMAEFADRVAFRAISELLGLPSSPEAEAFMRPQLEDIARRSGLVDAFRPESQEVREYISALLDDYSGDGSDLLGRVRAAYNEGVISNNEKIGLILGSWAAGRETTSTLISLLFGLLYEADLQSHAAFHAGPEGEAWRTAAIVEALRFTPFPASPRVCTVDTVHPSGFALKAGMLVQLHWDAANRDTEVFGNNIDTFVLGRENATRHMGFGYGLHYCLGAHLGAAEADLALRVVYGTLGRLQLMEWERTPGFANTVTRATFGYDLRLAARRIGVI